MKIPLPSTNRWWYLCDKYDEDDFEKRSKQNYIHGISNYENIQEVLPLAVVNLSEETWKNTV